MPVRKRKYSSGRIVWFYQFDHPCSTKNDRVEVKESGFASRKEAVDAETNRRLAVAKEWEEEKAKASGTPLTLAHLLSDFFEQRGKDLAPKTLERYKDQASYLAPELTSMPLGEITSLHLTREWSRLVQGGGRTRTTGTPRPMSAKTVRNIAGVVSSAFARGRKWGVVERNPVEGSDLPRWKKREGIALSPAQTRLLIEAANEPWCLSTILEISAATGCRRGELLALSWTDIIGGIALIHKSLCQTKDGLTVKRTKSERPRMVTLPESALAVLDVHRARQSTFREQFGKMYRTDLDLIFCNEDGSFLRPDSISSSVSALFKRLKLPKGASLHSLRHTHTSELLADGVDLITVSKRIGHANPSITAAIYSHVLDGKDKEAAQKWDEFQKRAGGQNDDRPEKVQ